MRNSQRHMRPPNDFTSVSAGILVTARPIPAAIAWVVCASTIYLGGRESLLLSVLHAAPVAWVAAAAFLLNDAYDADKDRLAGKPRPVALGVVPRGLANLSATILLLAAVLVPVARLRYDEVAVILLGAIGVVFYSPVSRARPLWKNLYTAILCVLPIGFGFCERPESLPLPSTAMLVLFVWGRELLLDVLDREGDLASGVATLGGRLRSRTGLTIAWGGMLFAAIGLWLGASNGLQVQVAIATVLATIATAAVFPLNSAASTLGSRLVLLLGGITIALGGPR